MPKRDETLVNDVTALAQATVEAEAIEKVWNEWASALDSLDEPSRCLIEQYFNGVPLETFCEERQIPLDKGREWLSRVRGQLVHALRTKIKVRQ